MMRVAVILLILASFSACGGDGPRHANDPEPYTVTGTVADPTTGSLTVSIAVASKSTERSVKEAAEAVIAMHRAEYPNIVVKAYPVSSDPSGLPYGTSILQDGVISHSFNPNYAEKIKTH
jgi:hypothetical protein